jgi:glutaredoxin
MSDASKGASRRCERHHIALSPQGECIVCLREARAQPSVQVVDSPFSAKIWVFLALLGFAIGTVFVARALLGSAPVSEQPLVVIPDHVITAPKDDPSFREQAEQAIVRRKPVVSREEPSGPIEPDKRADPAPTDSTPARDPISNQRKRPTKPDPEELRVLRRQVNVAMYTTQWCGVCRKARSYLQNEGISYEEFDIDEDSSAQERMLLLNPENSVPTFDIEGGVLRGWSAPGLQDAITRAAMKRWKRNEGGE